MPRVLELGSVVAAPFAGEVLARLGFEVIKVEPPGGDPTRRDDVLGDSMFIAYNMGKKTITLDLKTPEGKRSFIELIRGSDVFIENLSPGAMERLSISKDIILRENSSLVYCSIKGYPEGKYRNWPAFGTLAEAVSGVMWSNGNSRLPASITDMNCALYCVITVLWALLNKRAGYYEVTLVQSAAANLNYYLITYQTLGKLFPGTGDRLPFWAPYELFKTNNGYIYIAINSDYKWAKLCEALGINDLIADPRFKNNVDRVKNRDKLHEIIENITLKYSTEYLLELLLANDIPSAPLMTVADLINSDIFTWEYVSIHDKKLKMIALPLPDLGHG
jgi:crotonobetainyl-CoA:carnitine CoA-transferase CaiB-like acyl-CoA transferase